MEKREWRMERILEDGAALAAQLLSVARRRVHALHIHRGASPRRRVLRAETGHRATKGAGGVSHVGVVSSAREGAGEEGRGGRTDANRPHPSRDVSLFLYYFALRSRCAWLSYTEVEITRVCVNDDADE